MERFCALARAAAAQWHDQLPWLTKAGASRQLSGQSHGFLTECPQRLARCFPGGQRISATSHSNADIDAYAAASEHATGAGNRPRCRIWRQDLELAQRESSKANRSEPVFRNALQSGEQSLYCKTERQNEIKKVGLRLRRQCAGGRRPHGKPRILFCRRCRLRLQRSQDLAPGQKESRSS